MGNNHRRNCDFWHPSWVLITMVPRNNLTRWFLPGHACTAVCHLQHDVVLLDHVLHFHDHHRSAGPSGVKERETLRASFGHALERGQGYDVVGAFRKDDLLAWVVDCKLPVSQTMLVHMNPTFAA